MRPLVRMAKDVPSAFELLNWWQDLREGAFGVGYRRGERRDTEARFDRRHNPEDMLVTALSTCHMLSYLHMATVAGVVVTAYVDAAEGTMATEGDVGAELRVGH